MTAKGDNIGTLEHYREKVEHKDLERETDGLEGERDR